MAVGGVLLLFIPIVLVSFVVCFLWCAREWAILYMLRQSGSTVQAEIIDRYTQYRRHITAFVVYSFHDDDGRSYKRDVPMNTWKPDDWAIGKFVEVRFLPNNPSVSRLPNESRRPALTAVSTVIPFLAAYFLGIFAALALVVIWVVTFYINVQLLARPATATA